MAEGYLDREYLEDEYLSGINDPPSGMQVNQVIRKQATTGMQADQAIIDSHASGMQAAMTVVDMLNAAGMQANMITDTSGIFGFQVDMNIGDIPTVGGMQAKQYPLRHWLCDEGYLETPYLEESYLSYCMRAFLGMQARQLVLETAESGMQAEMHIVDKSLITGMQTSQVITKEETLGMQATQIRVVKTGMQAAMVIYNNTQLRILCEFPSRGTEALAGLNWVMSPTEAAGDFSPNNLNTDIIEQVTRSVTAGSITLTCDTGLSQGVPVDTIAILGHNLTKSAIVQVQGSKNPSFSPSDIVFTMETQLDDMYWIAETLPTLIGQNRYWRFTIQDPTNTDGYIEIGTILFGVSDIFTTSECFQNPIEHGLKHYKDEVETEGFTNIMNDRALRKWLRLSFEDLNYLKGNFKLIDDMVKYARTSLKCLVIPTPLYPERYAVFAKLVQLPSYSNRVLEEDADYTSFSLEWDESK